MTCWSSISLNAGKDKLCPALIKLKMQKSVTAPILVLARAIAVNVSVIIAAVESFRLVISMLSMRRPMTGLLQTILKC
jgi:hypothetical protein